MRKTASVRSLSILSALLCFLAIHSSASTCKVIYSFHGTDRELPLGKMITDLSGNLYGTTEFGGGAGKFGTVFQTHPRRRQPLRHHSVRRRSELRIFWRLRSGVPEHSVDQSFGDK